MKKKAYCLDESHIEMNSLFSEVANFAISVSMMIFATWERDTYDLIQQVDSLIK